MPQFFTGRIFEVSARYNGPNWAEIRAMWEDRANRIQWQEVQPQVQAQIEELQKPINDAREALKQATESKNEEAMASSQQQLFQAQSTFVERTMMMGARLGSSGNPYAAQGGAQLQQLAAGLASQSFNQAKLQQEREAEKWSREAQLRQEKLEAARFESQKGYQEKSLGLQQSQLDEQIAAREAADERADKGLGYEGRRVAVLEGQAKAEAERYDAQVFRDSISLIPELRASGMSEEAITSLVKQASGGRLDLSTLERRQKEVREADQAELDQIESDMKELQTAIEVAEESGDQRELGTFQQALQDVKFRRQQLYNARGREIIRRSKRLASGLPAERSLVEQAFNLLTLGSPGGVEWAEEQAARWQERREYDEGREVAR